MHNESSNSNDVTFPPLMPQEGPICVTMPPHDPLKTNKEVSAILRAHGCKIIRYTDRQEVVFPEGTKQKVKSITSAARYLLTLPSGLVVTQVEMPNRDYWLLFVDMRTG